MQHIICVRIRVVSKVDSVPNVRTLTEPYGAFLIHPLPIGPGVCGTCRAAVAEGYTACYACDALAAAGFSAAADAVVPISISIRHEQLATELWRYKELNDAEARRVLRNRLAAVLGRFLAAHEQCVADAADADSFELVTTVPSTGGRGRHPLREIVGDIVEVTKGRHADLLVANPAVPPGREVHPDRFLLLEDEPPTEIAGANILVVDDTWTKGGNAQSAAVRLKKAGANRVAIVVLGRHVDPDFPPAKAYLRQARRTGYSWERCCVHREGLW
jgi:hypothetical protein